MASELRVNSSTNRSGLGTITYTDSGPIVSGVGTFTNGLTVDGTQTTVKSLKFTGDNYNANWFKTSNKLRFNDNAKATFGTADDLSIYHDGSNNYIEDAGTGSLILKSNHLIGNAGAYSFMNAANSQTLIYGVEGGAVQLFHSGSKKFETSSAGINVSGITTSNNGFMFGTDGEMYLYKGAANTTTLRVTSNGPYVEFKDVSGDVQMGSASGTLLLSAGGNEKVRITGSGNVGIGTEGPETNLTIAKNATNQTVATIPTVRLTNLDTTAVATDIVGSYEFFSKDVHSLNKVTGFMRNTPTDAGVNYDLTFGTIKTGDSNAVERLRIKANGYVNIGTGSAEQQLTVQNSAQHCIIRVISKNTHDAGIDFGDTDDTDIAGVRYSNSDNSLSLNGNAVTRLKIDSGGRVMIGGGSSPSQVGDGRLIVYSTDRLHPAIKPAGMSNNYANGYSMLGDNYTATESQANLGLSYSSAGFVISRGVKVSGSADDTYLSSQAQYATRPCAIKLDSIGAFNFLTTETNATTAVDSAVSLTEVFKIDRVGNVYQKISGRNMYFGASNQLRIGVQHNGDPNIEAVSGDLKLMKGGSSIMQLRSDGFEMKQDIYFGTAGKGIVLGNTSNVDANTLDDYEEGSWTPGFQSGSGSFHVHSAVYTKIGRQVGIQFYLTLSNAGSNTNQAQITGLPFPVRAGGWTASKVSTGYNNSGIHCRAEQSTSRIDLKGAADTAVTFANINGTWILSSFIYFTDS